MINLYILVYFYLLVLGKLFEIINIDYRKLQSNQSIITNYLLLITVALSRILAFLPFVLSTTNTWFLGVDILVLFISPLRLPIISACSLPPSYIIKIPVSASIYISRSEFANINFKIYNEMSFDILHKCQRNQE